MGRTNFKNNVNVIEFQTYSRDDGSHIETFYLCLLRRVRSSVLEAHLFDIFLDNERRDIIRWLNDGQWYYNNQFCTDEDVKNVICDYVDVANTDIFYKIIGYTDGQFGYKMTKPRILSQVDKQAVRIVSNTSKRIKR